MDCEVCGNPGASIPINLDGNRLIACKDCASLGVKAEEPLPKAQIVSLAKKLGPRHDTFEDFQFVPGFGQKIKAARQKKNLTVEELALALAEKESFLHKLEAEKGIPNMALAKKIEKFLGIKILE